MINKGADVTMWCGAKCFIVEMEVAGKRKTEQVNARTHAGARKTVRSRYGKDTKIHSVREEKRL